jgi:altronate dehydratase
VSDAKDDASTSAVQPETITIPWEEAVQDQVNAIMYLQEKLLAMRDKNKEQLQQVPDLRVREMLQNQQVLWDVNIATLNGLMLMLFGQLGSKVMLSDIHEAMGCALSPEQRSN